MWNAVAVYRTDKGQAFYGYALERLSDLARLENELMARPDVHSLQYVKLDWTENDPSIFFGDEGLKPCWEEPISFSSD